MEHAEYGTLLAIARYSEILRRNGAIARDSADSGDDPTEVDHLLWMCNQLEQKIKLENMPVDKYSRWLGFIQGCMITRGLTTVGAERDITRPWFTRGEPV